MKIETPYPATKLETSVNKKFALLIALWVADKVLMALLILYF